MGEMSLGHSMGRRLSKMAFSPPLIIKFTFFGVRTKRNGLKKTRGQERMKVREVIPHIGPIPIVILLKLFLEGIDFLADNVTARVTCLSPFLILQRLTAIIHFHKRNCFSRYF